MEAKIQGAVPLHVADGAEDEEPGVVRDQRLKKLRNSEDLGCVGYEEVCGKIVAQPTPTIEHTPEKMPQYLHYAHARGGRSLK